MTGRTSFYQGHIWPYGRRLCTLELEVRKYMTNFTKKIFHLEIAYLIKKHRFDFENAFPRCPFECKVKCTMISACFVNVIFICYFLVVQK